MSLSSQFLNVGELSRFLSSCLWTSIGTGTCRLTYLILPDETVGLQRFPPAQTDLLLIAAAQDGLHRDSTRNYTHTLEKLHTCWTADRDSCSCRTVLICEYQKLLALLPSLRVIQQEPQADIGEGWKVVNGVLRYAAHRVLDQLLQDPVLQGSPGGDRGGVSQHHLSSSPLLEGNPSFHPSFPSN